uniref:Uncharacterized protein n=1 Tax=Rhizophora mucronata TaxID=61149 RepID=A0A2P2P8A4_RHIMU
MPLPKKKPKLRCSLLLSNRTSIPSLQTLTPKRPHSPIARALHWCRKIAPASSSDSGGKVHLGLPVFLFGFFSTLQFLFFIPSIRPFKKRLRPILKLP